THSTTPPPTYTLSLHDALPISPRSSVDNPNARRSQGPDPALTPPPGSSHRTPARPSCATRPPLARRLGWLDWIWTVIGSIRGARSEEHTSELQSRFDLVCRLLL